MKREERFALFSFFENLIEMSRYILTSVDCLPRRRRRRRKQKKKKKKKTKEEEEEEEEEEILFIIFFFAWCKRRSDARKWCAVDTTRA